MRKLIIDESYSSFYSIKKEDIDIFEKKHNVSFTEKFINFLITYKGGRTKERIFFHNEIEYSISSFLTLSNDKNDCIEKIYLATKMSDEDGGLDRSDLIPFATDGGGNPFYLSLQGSVFYCRLWSNKLTKLTDSFEEFIDGLQPESQVL